MVRGKKEIFLDSRFVLPYNSFEGFLSHVDLRGTSPRTTKHEARNTSVEQDRLILPSPCPTEHEGIMGGMNDANAYPYEKLQIVER